MEKCKYVKHPLGMKDPSSPFMSLDVSSLWSVPFCFLWKRRNKKPFVEEKRPRGWSMGCGHWCRCCAQISPPPSELEELAEPTPLCTAKLTSDPRGLTLIQNILVAERDKRVSSKTSKRNKRVIEIPWQNSSNSCSSHRWEEMQWKTTKLLFCPQIHSHFLFACLPLTTARSWKLGGNVDGGCHETE